MVRKKKPGTEAQPPGVRLPKGVINRLDVGQSFAEYDSALEDETVYVRTPAFNAALRPQSGKYFFVGRRGTGKTALRTFCDLQLGHSRVVVPEIFSPMKSVLELELFTNTRAGPFRSLVNAFKRTLLDEILVMWHEVHSTHASLSESISAELAGPCRQDFDSRAIQMIAAVGRAYASGEDESFIAENKLTKSLVSDMKELQRGGQNSYTLLIDSIDDYWEGQSEVSLTYLTAFMHACLELSTQIPWARALLFLRENIFERVRARDPESSRMETAISGLDWTEKQLIEMVERRLNRALTSKFPLGGATWDAFFETPVVSRQQILDYCHNRPRDVLIYATHAINSAQEQGHERILLEDVEGARRRFSDNRFKDLGDEYAENYPQIALVLSRFYGLGRTFTPGGIEAFVRMLLRDDEVKRLCAGWIFENQALETFIRLLYNIGFVGLARPGHGVRYRALGPQDTSPPAVTDDTIIAVHKCYWDALDLQDTLVRQLSEDQGFGRIGVLLDLPGGLDPSTYTMQLDELLERLQRIPKGSAGSRDFEDAVGAVIQLCFFRALENVEPRERSDDGTVIRDWIASNRAQTGFWANMRHRYDATQVVWECKNYENLKAADFQQASYYLTEPIGRFGILTYRGEVQPKYLAHVKRIFAEKKALVLPLGIRDLTVFVRQARNGKVKEDHLQDRYDSVVRKIS